MEIQPANIPLNRLEKNIGDLEETKSIMSEPLDTESGGLFEEIKEGAFNPLALENTAVVMERLEVTVCVIHYI